MDNETKVEIFTLESCQIQQEREKAIAVSTGETEVVVNEINGIKRTRTKWFWLPKSQIRVEPNGSKYTVVMPMWLAKEKGFVDED